MKRIPKIVKKIIKWGIVIVIIIAGGTFLYQRFIGSRIIQSSAESAVIRTAEVTVRDIQNVLSSSGTIGPLASYGVTTLVQGEVTAADFEEGDIVQEGQVLYQIATDNLDSQIENAETAISRAEEDYAKAEDSYQDAQDDYKEANEDYEEALNKNSNTTVESSASGIVTALFVQAGDTIQKGSQIAEIYDNSIMLLTIPFSASEVDSSLVGEEAEVVIEDSFESLKGKVTKVGSIDKVLTGNRLVKEVTIEVENPGGLTEQTVADAIIGDLYSMDTGTFSVKTNAVITSDLSGEIHTLSLQEGGRVKDGDVVITISEDAILEQLENYRKAVDNAQDAVDNAREVLKDKEEAIEDAQAELQEIIDTRTNYSITAPVTGKVISKDILKGDTIGSSNFNSALCTIYDLSSVTFNMYVDELDVMKVVKGQEVEITADALEGVQIKGVVTNVSLQSTSSQGVTQYPVTVRIDDVGNLLPGMNVTGEIIVEKAEGVLAIPSDALQRGDVVYIKDDTVTEALGDIPAGFRSVQVTTGITDGDYIEVTGGLSEGDEIYLTRTAASEGAVFEGMMSEFSIPGVSGRSFQSDTQRGTMPSRGSQQSGGSGGGFPGN